MRKSLETILLVSLTFALLYVGREEILRAYHTLYDRVLPCSAPITYQVGTYDPKFNLSEAQFAAAIAQAESLWEEAAGRDLFAPTDTGRLTINLAYDYRQEATDRLRELGLVVEDDRASYDTLKAKYDALERTYTQERSVYEAAVAAFTKKQDAYNAQVKSWNARGGAPRDAYAQLEEEKQALNVTRAHLQAVGADLKEQVTTINALVSELNRLATTLNITASEFNQVGKARGEEFTEGLYISDAEGKRIDIYQFDTEAKLVRVLTHELGHALGLEHVEDPKAIMYRLNQGTNEKLSDADIAELRAVCKIK